VSFIVSKANWVLDALGKRLEHWLSVEIQHGGLPPKGTAGKQDAQNGCWLGFPAPKTGYFFPKQLLTKPLYNGVVNYSAKRYNLTG
jgi:hypothetical protein